MRLAHHVVRKDPFAGLSRFRGEFCSCLTRRADALLELADAVLCADGLVRSLVELSLVGEHRRGHGGLYDALSAGRGDIVRLRRALAAVPLPRSADGRLVLAADLTYEEVFRATAGPLDKAQANKQRPLWASTGVKDTLYVDDLDAIKILASPTTTSSRYWRTRASRSSRRPATTCSSRPRRSSRASPPRKPRHDGSGAAESAGSVVALTAPDGCRAGGSHRVRFISQKARGPADAVRTVRPGVR